MGLQAGGALPVATGLELRHHHAVPPGLQVPLRGHLAARGVLVHLADALHLPAATQAHVGRRLHIGTVVHRRCWEKSKTPLRCTVQFWKNKVKYTHTHTHTHTHTRIHTHTLGSD